MKLSTSLPTSFAACGDRTSPPGRARFARRSPSRARRVLEHERTGGVMTASQHMVQANGLRFRAMVDGPPTGDMFILLHGFPEGAESWSRQLGALAAAGYLAVALDLRGYGLTEAPEARESYAIDHLVEDVRLMIKAFGRPAAHVAGHDWGAMVAWFFAGRYPEMTKTLTVLSVPHPAALAAASRDDADQQRRSRYVELFLLEGKAERVLADDEYRRLRSMFR